MRTDSQAVSTETLLQLLAHPRRRAILHHLVENDDEVVALDKLAGTIATDGGSETIPHESENTRTRVELHHTHLPKLAAAGIIKYDTVSRTVRYHSVNNPDHKVGASSWFPQIIANTPCNLDAYPFQSKVVSNGYEG